MRKLVVLLGAVFASIAASACCILPALLGVTSAGTVGFGAVLAPYRPYFMGLTLLMLGTGFYFTYRPQKAACCDIEDGCLQKRSSRVRRFNGTMLWLVTLFTLGSLAYPTLSAYRAESASADVVAVEERKAKTVVFTVGNMPCKECTLPIVKALKKISGVYTAKVDFVLKRATIRYDAERVSTATLRKTIEQTGFSVVAVGK
jgi:mercuric ion transport protein